MKKFLTLVVLGLTWCGNAQSKEILLTCKGFNVNGYYKGGDITDKPFKREAIEVFKIDAKEKIILTYGQYTKIFSERKTSKFSKTIISWKDPVEWKDRTIIHEINLVESTYKIDTKLKSNPKLDRIIANYKCSK